MVWQSFMNQFSPGDPAVLFPCHFVPSKDLDSPFLLLLLPCPLFLQGTLAKTTDSICFTRVLPIIFGWVFYFTFSVVNASAVSLNINFFFLPQFPQSWQNSTTFGIGNAQEACADEYDGKKELFACVVSNFRVWICSLPEDLGDADLAPTPTAKAGGFLFLPPTALAHTLRYCNVLHSVHKLDYTVPVCPTVQSYYCLC